MGMVSPGAWLINVFWGVVRGQCGGRESVARWNLFWRGGIIFFFSKRVVWGDVRCLVMSDVFRSLNYALNNK